MTDAEAKMMNEHVAYWNDLTNRGVVIIFGPVLDPNGMWGLAVVEAKEKSEI
ncbi:YciI family protein, partial [Candidatus Nitrosotalea sp. FS]|uniref:YciI family protein n=1 Tax=Candidatus Nitrosotalea sp. FS TaxID=2341021 RepID=UPI0037421E8D